MQVLSERAVLRQNAPAANHKKVASISTAAKPSTGTGSGVYFNDRVVPQEMHIPSCSPRHVISSPGQLPSAGNPMPQPPRLMITALGTQVNQRYSKSLDAAKDSPGVALKQRSHPPSCGYGERRPTKRLCTTTPKYALTSEQQAFVDAALVLASVKGYTFGRESPCSKITSIASPNSSVLLPSALPPPPFSLSKRLDIADSHKEHLGAFSEASLVQRCSALAISTGASK